MQKGEPTHRDTKGVAREATIGGRGVCFVDEAMQKFTMEGIDHMEWDACTDQFVKTSPEVLPLMEVQVKVLFKLQQKFLGRRASLWTKLGRSQPARERGLADTGAMVCTAWMDTARAMGLQVDIQTKMVVRGVKRSNLTVLGVVAVEISAEHNIS